MSTVKPLSWAGALLIVLAVGCDAEPHQPVDSVAATREPSWSEQLSEVQSGRRTEMRVIHSVVTIEDWETLSSDCESLEVLDVESLQVRGDAFALLPRLPRLRQLRIGSPIGDTGLSHMALIASLRVLNLPRGEFTDDGLRGLAALPDLELLRFHSPHVTDRGMRSIANFPSLRFLHLIDVPITDDGLRHLEGFQQLESLYLDGCRCTDDGIRRLLKSLPQLHLHRDQLHLEDDPHAHTH